MTTNKEQASVEVSEIDVRREGARITVSLKVEGVWRRVFQDGWTTIDGHKDAAGIRESHFDEALVEYIPGER